MKTQKGRHTTTITETSVWGLDDLNKTKVSYWTRFEIKEDTRNTNEARKSRKIARGHRKFKIENLTNQNEFMQYNSHNEIVKINEKIKDL